MQRRTLLTGGLVCAAVGIRQLVKRWPAGVPTGLRVGTWNLRNFPDGHDLEWVRESIEDLAPDLLALQEVVEPAGLDGLLGGRKPRFTVAGGRGGQRLGIAYDPRRLAAVGDMIEHVPLAMGGRVRPAFVQQLETVGTVAGTGAGMAGGWRFWVVVVHLKARPQGQAMRREQWRLLGDLVGTCTGPVVVMGDFNVTGAKRDREQGPEVELEDLERELGRVALARLPVVGGCTAYWDGVRRDVWQEPSLLDLIWVNDGWGQGAETTLAKPAGHCARHECQAFQASDAYPDLDLRASDHCAVLADLPMGPGEP